MKKEYNIKDRVWIHLGEKNLVEGRVVEIIDLEHLNEGHKRDQELYVIELKTGIDDVYEVRSFQQISPDARGPIQLFRNLREVIENNRYLKKVGMPIPIPPRNALEEISKEINEELTKDDDEPTAEQIHAAIEKSQQSAAHAPLNLQKEHKPKRRYFKKKKTV
jgi:hypothetical protein